MISKKQTSWGPFVSKIGCSKQENVVTMSWPWNFAEQLCLKCLWTAASVTSVFPFIKILLIITETYEAQEKIWLYPTTHYYHKLRLTYIDMKRVTYIDMKRVTQKGEWVNLVVKKNYIYHLGHWKFITLMVGIYQKSWSNIFQMLNI